MVRMSRARKTAQDFFRPLARCKQYMPAMRIPAWPKVAGKSRQSHAFLDMPAVRFCTECGHQLLKDMAEQSKCLHLQCTCGHTFSMQTTGQKQSLPSSKSRFRLRRPRRSRNVSCTETPASNLGLETQRAFNDAQSSLQSTSDEGQLQCSCRFTCGTQFAFQEHLAGVSDSSSHCLEQHPGDTCALVLPGTSQASNLDEQTRGCRDDRASQLRSASQVHLQGDHIQDGDDVCSSSLLCTLEEKQMPEGKAMDLELQKALEESLKLHDESEKSQGLELQEALEESRKLYHESEKSKDQKRERLQQVMKRHKAKLQPVEADGNCQFRALSLAMKGEEKHHSSLRARVVEQLRGNPDRYRQFVHSEPYADYLIRLEREGEWGDHVTLQAACDAFQVQINVFTDQPGGLMKLHPVQPAQVISQEPLYLAFMSEFHYDAAELITKF
eukprot:TRINITY_DN76142_c0_g1_i1.p1 TRINITY_DN76142_c0_g1~~TRINITY_DN76142_c0_g1_i1.p1  ORF type:complete len:441 (-),score=80.05 TRINITY_DN76142_c0_g1_i1:88-1410(-)